MAVGVLALVGTRKGLFLLWGMTTVGAGGWTARCLTAGGFTTRRSIHVTLDGNGLPSGFGFPILIDPKDPDKAFVIPERGFEYHYGPNGRLAVYRTRDAGLTWEEMSDGLPRQAWAAVLREASASDADSLYFGTQSGSFFALADGDTWVEAARHLPPVLSVEVTQWSR